MTDLEFWKSLDEDTAKELETLDGKEIEDRFYKNLEFGTGGMRGIMGAGPNRMNIYTVAKATKGLADYLKTASAENSVAIAFDSRNNSEKFAKIAACVLAKEGIGVRIFKTLQPTPVLSFTVRKLGCSAGIVITASHNPKEYNGYKVYDSDGCQLTPVFADKLISFVNAVSWEDVKYIKGVREEDFDTIKPVEDEVVADFISECRKLSLYKPSQGLKIVYTPLHGTGNLPVREILSDYDVTVVSQQEKPDGNFSTVRSPNPEERDALNLAVETAKEIQADLVIGTDPDCDRVGIAVKHGGDYRLMTGNQVGALLMDFILTHKNLPGNPAVVKTIVTSGLGAEIAKSHGCKVFETLTGFKYIGEKICQWEADGSYNYVFGYEESYGYLAGTHARDKDAVSSSFLIAQMAAYNKSRGKTLVDALEEIYECCGYFYDCLETIVLKGKDGSEKIRAAMDYMRKNSTALFDDAEKVEDYSLGIDGLPKENVLKFHFSDGSWAAARPSGTEPKLKMYYSVKAKDRNRAVTRQQNISAVFNKAVNNAG